MISVIISAYREDLSVFEAAVSSILEQKGLDTELVLALDDPNNQELLSWVDNNLQGNPNVVVVKNETNLGLARSLNHALEYASGEYIARMDADDIAAPDRLETQLSYLLEHGLDLIGGRMNVMSEQGTILYTTPELPQSPEKVRTALRWNNCLPHPTWFGKRTVFAQQYRDIPLCEDYDFQIRAALNGFKLGNSQDVVLNYRLSDTGLSRSNLFRQYLYQRYITKEYRQGKVSHIEDAREYVDRKFSETRAQKYSIANDAFQKALNDLSNKKLGSALAQGMKSAFSSADYTDKIRRLVLASLYARIDK